MTENEEKDGESGTHQDNDLTRVQKIMKDNDLPTFHTSQKDEDDDNRSTD